jgi:hypothetical protein
LVIYVPDGVSHKTQPLHRDGLLQKEARLRHVLVDLALPSALFPPLDPVHLRVGLIAVKKHPCVLIDIQGL